MELILSAGDTLNKDVRKAFAESSMLDRVGANMAEVLRHTDALSVASLVSPLAAVARAGSADNVSKLTKKMLGVFFEEKRTDSKVGRGGVNTGLGKSFSQFRSQVYFGKNFNNKNIGTYLLKYLSAPTHRNFSERNFPALIVT